MQNILGSEAKLAMNRQRSQLRSLIRLVKLKMSDRVIFAELNGQTRIYRMSGDPPDGRSHRFEAPSVQLPRVCFRYL